MLGRVQYSSEIISLYQSVVAWYSYYTMGVGRVYVPACNAYERGLHPDTATLFCPPYRFCDCLFSFVNIDNHTLVQAPRWNEAYPQHLYTASRIQSGYDGTYFGSSYINSSNDFLHVNLLFLDIWTFVL